MDYSKIKTEDLMEVYKTINEFLTFLKKEKETIERTDS